MTKVSDKHHAELEAFFCEENRVTNEDEEHLSPSGDYKLTISHYRTKEGCWNYSRGVVTKVSDSAIIADVKRNYHSFWYEWAKHPNESEYLLCGEDYQGYSVINLTEEVVHTYLPKEAQDGAGFCWASVKFLPEENQVEVSGCIWAGPYEMVRYDFANPDHLPLPELERRWMEEDDWDDDDDDLED